MVELSQGEIWWAELPLPVGAAPGFTRPVIVVQGDSLNRSRIGTVLCVPLTSNLKWSDAPGSVMFPKKLSGLPKDSVANASQIVALDRAVLTSRVSRIGPKKLAQLLTGIDIVLGL